LPGASLKRRSTRGESPNVLNVWEKGGEYKKREEPLDPKIRIDQWGGKSY